MDKLTYTRYGVGALPFSRYPMARSSLYRKCMSTKKKATNDSFLADQVHRIRQLVDQLAQVQKEVWGNLEDIQRPATESMRPGPLEAVRDYRTYDSPHDLRDRGSSQYPLPATAHHAKPRKRRH